MTNELATSAGSALEELHQALRRADLDDDRRIVGVGQHDREVVRRPGGDEPDRVDLGLLEALGAALVVGGRRRDHHLGAGVERAGGQLVERAQHDVGLVPGVEERVGAVGHADQHGIALADPLLDAPQVRLPAERLAHHDDRALAEPLAEPGHARPFEQHGALALQVVGGVGHQRLEPGREALVGLAEAGRDRRVVLRDALGDERLALEHAVAVDPHRLAVLQTGPHALTDLVDQGDAGVGKDPGSEVGVPAGARLRRVDDGAHPAVDERLGLAAVEVGQVDDGDVARTQRGRGIVATACESGHAGESGGGVGGRG